MKSSNQNSERVRGLFNPTLLKKNVTRFWPIWGVYAAVMAFLLPVELMMRTADAAPREIAAEVAAVQRSATLSALYVGLVFGAITAMALFSYLMSSRSVQMLHALPIRREGLFLTNWLSGLAFFLAPNLVIFLFAAVVEAGAGALDLAGLCRWLTTATACPMFFFCFAVCVAMFTGHILAMPVFFGIANVLVMGICALMDFTGGELLYNYAGSDLTDSDFARWCTPVAQLRHLLCGEYGAEPTASGVFNATCYCIVLGAVFTTIALGLYRLRQLERAGDVITVGWFRPVFQGGLGVCVGLAFGLLLYARFFYPFDSGVYIILVALCTVIGAFAGRMLLKKTLRVFADGWKSCLALGLIMAAALWGVRADLLGFQRWTPDPDKVQRVSIYGLNTAPFDDGSYMSAAELTRPEDIRQVIDIHKTLNEHLPALRADQEPDADITYLDSEGRMIAGDNFLRISYTLADGSEVSRSYPLVIRAEELEQPGTWAAELNRMVNDPGIVTNSYLGYCPTEDLTAVKAASGWISRSDYEDEFQVSNGTVELAGESAQKLWDAFREDLAAGRVKRYLLEDEERLENCYLSDIYLYLTWYEVDENGEREPNSWTLCFTPQKSQTSVMAALEELGLETAVKSRGR